NRPAVNNQAFVYPAKNELKNPIPALKSLVTRGENRVAAAKNRPLPAASSFQANPGGGKAAPVSPVTTSGEIAGIQPVTENAFTPEALERARAHFAPAGGTDLFPGPRPATG